MQISFLQAVLIGLVYYLGNGPWLAGVGYYTLYRPLVAGFLVGLILGDPVQGTIVGAAINLMYLGFISAGGSLPADPCLAGTVGAAIAIASNLDPKVAVALAAPIGLLGTLIWFVKMTVNATFAHVADRYAEEGNTRGIMLANVVYPQILLFVISVIPVFLASYYGASSVQTVLDFLGGKVLHILMVIGGMLPALGIAINMRAITKRDTIMYYFLGFFLVMYLKLDVVAIAIFGAIIAYAVVISSRKERTT